MLYVPGITFLFLVNAVIAVPFAIHVKQKAVAILLSFCLSTLLLKTWAYLAVGHFDLGFLMAQTVIGLCATIAIHLGLAAIRRQTQTN